MSIFFAFSDETGLYKQNPGKRTLQAHPYYVRSTVIIKADNWRQLHELHAKNRLRYQIPSGNELKWSHLWSLRCHEKSGKPIRREHPYHFLRNHSSEQLIGYVDRCLGSLGCLSYVRVILTVTQNQSNNKFEEKHVLRFHLQEHMQRIEMEVQIDSDALCVLFIDPVDEKNDKQLREAYHTIAVKGDLIEKYRHIKDSLNMECSHHSCGIQQADYVAGVFSGMLRGFDESCRIFHSHIFSHLRRDKESGTIMGYGVREVPSNREVRESISEQITRV